MNINLFESLDLHSQVYITWKQGIQVGYHSQGHYYMSLYRLQNFYVEVQYHTCYDGIASIQTFICEEQLQPYLDQIDLKEVLPF